MTNPARPALVLAKAGLTPVQRLSWQPPRTARWARRRERASPSPTSGGAGLPSAFILSIVLVLPPTALGAQLQHIPKPTTDGMEPQVAELLDGTWHSLAEALDPAADVQDAERAAAVGEAGEVFHAHEALNAAIACYRQAMELDPRSARWPYLLGYIFKNQGRSDESLELLENSQSLEPNPFTRFRTAEVLAAEGRVEEAAEILAPLDGVEGLEAAVAAELGKIAQLRGDVTAAIDYLTAALDIQPEAISLHFPLALALRSIGDDDAAERHAALAGQRRVRPNDPILRQVGVRSVSSETYVSMGAQAIQAGQPEAAKAAYSKAAELNPDNKRAWMNLGVLAKEEQALAEAEGHLRRALALDPDYGFAHFNLAEVLSEDGSLSEASSHYLAAVNSNPKNLVFGLAYGDHLLRIRALEQAAAQYQKVAEQTPDFARPHYLRALALVALNEVEGAAESAATAHSIDATDEEVTRAFVRLGSVDPSGRWRAESLAAAQGLFEQHRSTDEGELLAMALAANGRFEEAARIQAQIVAALRDASVEGAALTWLEGNLERYGRGERAERAWPE